MGTGGMDEVECAPLANEGAVHWNHTLHLVSLSILWLMGAHIFGTMVTYQLLFFKNVFYIADMIIIGKSPAPSSRPAQRL